MADIKDFKHAIVRQKILDAVRKDLIGPASDCEQLNEVPTSSYITGLLYPDDTDVTEDENYNDVEFTEKNFDADGETLEVGIFEEEEPEDRVKGGFQKPSSIGVSFYVSNDVQKVNAYINWGKYYAEQVQGEAIDKTLEEDAENKKKKKHTIYIREQMNDVVEINFNEMGRSKQIPLESGSVDAICMDMGVAKYELEARGSQFRMLSEQVSKEQYGIGFKTGNTELRDTVQDTLYEMLADGTFESIAKDWGLEESICLSADNKVNDVTEDKASGSFVSNFADVVGKLASGMLATLGIFFLTLVFSLPLGMLLMFIRVSKIKVVQWLAKIYISIMRGTPLMLQLLVVFFGPYYIFGISLSYSYRFYAVIIGFSLNYAAYFAEIFRSGIEAIPIGQHEAASVLGYTKSQTFIRIIFPQMMRIVLPSVTNEVITLVKDTSLAFALAYTEMFTLAKQIAAANASIMPLFVAGVFYYIFNFVVAWVMETIEKKMRYYK